MQEPGIDLQMTFMPHEQPPIMTQPGNRALDNPTMAIAAQLPPILMRRRPAPRAGRDNRLDAPPGQAGAQRIAVIAPIEDQPVGLLGGRPRLVRLTATAASVWSSKFTSA